MSHPEQLQFFRLVADANSELVRGARVLEIGSYDVNGTVREMFRGAAEHIGVDLTPGPGVDIVAYGHHLDEQDGTFDLAISGECFEHDPYWRATFATMVRLVRAGGIVAFTCASRGRVEHGTLRTDATLSPGTQEVGLDHYRNVEADDFDDVPIARDFSQSRFWFMPTSRDLYFAGVRAGDDGLERVVGRLPEDEDVRAIASVMSLPHRLVRLPLRLLSWMLPARSYQAVARPYWYTLLRVQERLVGNGFLRSPRTLPPGESRPA